MKRDMTLLDYGYRYHSFMGNANKVIGTVCHETGLFLAHGSINAAKQCRSMKRVNRYMMASAIGGNIIIKAGNHWTSSANHFEKATAMLNGYNALLRCEIAAIGD